MGFLRALAVAGGRRHRKLFPFLLVRRRRKFWGLLLPRCSVMEFPREESGSGKEENGVWSIFGSGRVIHSLSPSLYIWWLSFLAFFLPKRIFECKRKEGLFKSEEESVFDNNDGLRGDYF